MCADDIEYLSRKDALTIPKDGFRDELLRLYITIVHPLLPILDVNDVIGPILRGDGHNPVSLLLFQAIMFSSVTFVDIEMLRSQGYPSRKSARKRLFRRVRLLYGLDCEQDHVALIQSLLLMAYWYDAPEDEKDTWYWMGLGLSMTRVIGLHRDPASLRISSKAKRQRKRLWWSYFIRDRLLGLGLRRPARIRPDECNVPMLTLDDFETEPVCGEVATLLGGWALPQDAEATKTLAVTCVELAKLCLCIGHILLSQYSVLGDQPARSNYMVLPRKTPEQVQELAKCDEELSEWLQTLESCSRHTAHPVKSQHRTSILAKAVSVHTASLYMIYLTAVGALHRPRVFSSASMTAGNEASWDDSRQKLTDAAVAVTQLAYDMQLRDQVRYLSTSSIPAFTSAALMHLLDIRSTKEDIRNIGVGRFFQCMQVLWLLRDMYASADYAIHFLRTVVQSTNVQLPMFSFHPHLTSIMPNSSYMGHCASTGNGCPTPLSFSHQPAIAESPRMCEAPTNSHWLNPATDAAHIAMLLPDGIGSQRYYSEYSHEDPSVASPQHSNWNEDDNLLCALINFETDLNFSM